VLSRELCELTFTAGSDPDLTISLYFWTPNGTENVSLGDWRAQFKVHLTPKSLLYLEKSEENAYYDHATPNGKLLSKRKIVEMQFLFLPVCIS
jgi:hypothetical protein